MAYCNGSLAVDNLYTGTLAEVCPGDATAARIKCGGSWDTVCTRFQGPNFTTYHLFTNSGSTYHGATTLYQYYKSGGSWVQWASSSWAEFWGWRYEGWTWNDFTDSYEVKTSLYHPGTGTYSDSFWYINWFYTTLKAVNQDNVAMQGVKFYVDGVLAGTTNASGEVTIIGPIGSFVLTSDPSGATGYSCETMAPEVASKTVNVTLVGGDQTVTYKHYPINDCITYNPASLVSMGSTLTSPCQNTWIVPGKGSWQLKLTDVSIDRQSLWDVKRPWDTAGTFGVTDVLINQNSWSPEWSDATYGKFKFYVSDIWYGSGESRWAKVQTVCFKDRQGLGTGIVDTSEVYVDCASGNDANSGLYSFANALRTITKAQTVVANNGTIYIKYGDCLDEVLASVLNPIQNNVSLSPRQDDDTEGTGTVTIDGT